MIQGSFWLLSFLLARPVIIALLSTAVAFFKLGKESEKGKTTL